MSDLTYGDNIAYAIPEDAVPVAVLWKFAQRTYAHVMGNEAAAALKAKRDNGGMTDGMTDEQFLHNWRVAKRQAIIDGTLSVRTGGPRVDPLVREMRTIAVTRLRAVAVRHTPKGQKVVFPTKGDGEYTFPNGQTMTLSKMVEAYLAKNGEDVKAEATRIIRERQRATSNAEKKAEATSGISMQDFGL